MLYVKRKFIYRKEAPMVKFSKTDQISCRYGLDELPADITKRELLYFFSFNSRTNAAGSYSINSRIHGASPLSVGRSSKPHRLLDSESPRPGSHTGLEKKCRRFSTGKSFCFTDRQDLEAADFFSSQAGNGKCRGPYQLSTKHRAKGSPGRHT